MELVGVGDEENLANLDVYLVDERTIAVESCHPLSHSTRAFLKSALPKPKDGQKKLIRLCVPEERIELSDLQELAKIDPNWGVEANAAIAPHGHFLGRFTGIDRSLSGLDRAVRRYQQLLHIQSNPSFPHLEKVFQEIRFDIEFLLSISQATNLNQSDRRRLESQIDARIVDHYLLGTLLFFDSNNVDTLRVNDVQTVRQALLGPSGHQVVTCLLYTSPSPRDRQKSRMPSSA